MKVLTKKAIYNLCAKSYENIIASIKNKSVISFDVFNTLIHRDVIHPEDVFKLLEEKVFEKFHIENFKMLRINAEREARKEHTGREIQLQEIYEHFPVDDAIKNHLMKMECEEEILVSTQNIVLKRVYDYCIETGKVVYFISDMYLPTDTVNQILKKNGYNSGKLYVSSESGKRKRNGTLFQYVKEQESIQSSEWIHLGDSIISDYLQPKHLGIEAVLIEQSPNYFEYIDKKLIKKDANYKRMVTFINNRISNYTDPYEIIGYGVLGPLLYGFSCWLDKEIQVDQKIVFFAREGALLQRAFSIVTDKPSIYLHISRHAAYEAFVDHCKTPEQVLNAGLRILKDVCTKEEFARSYGLSDNDIDRIFQENNLIKEEMCPKCEDKKQILNIIWPYVKSKVADQYDLMKSYLRKQGIEGDCAVIDVGWRCTIQAILESLTFEIDGKTISWDGYYMGCKGYRKSNSDSSYQTIVRHGYFFDFLQNKKNRDTIENSVSFFELLFLSTEGTTKYYAADEAGNIIAVTGQPDNTPEINFIIDKIQSAGIQFVRDAIRISLPVNADISFANYREIARIPTLGTIKLFQDFFAYDEHSYSLANDHALGYYLLHPQQFVREFLKKPSRAWFLKGTFKLPLPYIAFLNFLRFFFDEK